MKLLKSFIPEVESICEVKSSVSDEGIIDNIILNSIVGDYLDPITSLVIDNHLRAGTRLHSSYNLVNLYI